MTNQPRSDSFSCPLEPVLRVTIIVLAVGGKNLQSFRFISVQKAHFDLQCRMESYPNRTVYLKLPKQDWTFGLFFSFFYCWWWCAIIFFPQFSLLSSHSETCNWIRRFGPDTTTFFRLNIKNKQQRLFKYWEKGTLTEMLYIFEIKPIIFLLKKIKGYWFAESNLVPWKYSTSTQSC